jgi:hypothetical protein
MARGEGGGNDHQGREPGRPPRRPDTRFPSSAVALAASPAAGRPTIPRSSAQPAARRAGPRSRGVRSFRGSSPDSAPGVSRLRGALRARVIDGPGLRADRPLISPPSDLDGEAPAAERGNDQAAARVGGIRLGMAGRTERHQPVEVEVRAPLGALDDVLDVLSGGDQQCDEMRCCGARGCRERIWSRGKGLGPVTGRSPTRGRDHASSTAPT